MGHVLVAAWIGVMVGWMGFGWMLAEAPSDTAVRVAMETGPVQGGMELKLAYRV